jgi:hypothetical protein
MLESWPSFFPDPCSYTREDDGTLNGFVVILAARKAQGTLRRQSHASYEIDEAWV